MRDDASLWSTPLHFTDPKEGPLLASRHIAQRMGDFNLRLERDGASWRVGFSGEVPMSFHDRITALCKDIGPLLSSPIEITLREMTASDDRDSLFYAAATPEAADAFFHQRAIERALDCLPPLVPPEVALRLARAALERGTLPRPPHAEESEISRLAKTAGRLEASLAQLAQAPNAALITRQTYLVTVLGDAFHDYQSLSEIGDAIFDGGSTGQFTLLSSEQISDKQVARQAVEEVGSDPDFFMQLGETNEDSEGAPPPAPTA